MQSVPPRATGNVTKTGNIRYTDAIGENAATGIQSTINFQDSLGTNYSLAIRYRFLHGPQVGPPAVPAQSAGGFTAPAGGMWVVERAPSMTRTEDNTTINIAGGATAPEWTVMSTLNFNENGNPITLTGAAPLPATLPGPAGIMQGGFVFDINIDAAGLPPGVYFGQPRGDTTPPGENVVRVDLTGITQHSGNTNVRALRHDGLAPGTLIGLSIGADGVITGTYSNGQAFPLWQIAIATFDNPAGLAAMGNNLFALTTNSGDFDGIGMTPGAAGTQLLGGTLEMSNVDLGAEFVEMITTQRGFQANSRVISTSDEMLQELVNLRR